VMVRWMNEEPQMHKLTIMRLTPHQYILCVGLGDGDAVGFDVTANNTYNQQYWLCLETCHVEIVLHDIYGWIVLVLIYPFVLSDVSNVV